VISLQIEIDEDTDRFLTEIATEYDGDRGKALISLIRTQQLSEEFLDQCEEFHHDSLVMQKERSDRGFREGRWTTLEQLKRQNGL